MQQKWHFNELRPSDRTRESQVEKFFSADAVANRANAIVREGIQNSLDASVKGESLNVRIAIATWSLEEQKSRLPKYVRDLMNHLASWRKKHGTAPTIAAPMRFMVFEDFGTTGLAGDPAQWRLEESSAPNPFFNYFRAEGVSDKEGSSRGRHGVGKFVFAAASKARAIFGVTRRDDGRELMMGTCILNNHFLNNTTYLPDGWFGTVDDPTINPVMPVEADSDFIAQFKTDFKITRKLEPGLSVVVPWLDEETDEDAIITGVLEGYFYPILKSHLTVEVDHENGTKTIISATTIDEIATTQSTECAARIKPVLELAKTGVNAKEWLTLNAPAEDKAPEWTTDCIPEDIRTKIQEGLDAGKTVTIKVPMFVRPKAIGSSQPCSFTICMCRDPNVTDGQITFVREGIIVSDIRPRRTSGIRAMVLIEEGPLATFLGDAENPAHTQWQHDLVKDSYFYAPAHLRYVVQCVPQLMTLLSDAQKKPDPSLLIDLFSLPDLQSESKKTKQNRDARKPGADPDTPIDPPTPRARSYQIRKSENGFAILRGDPSAARPYQIAFKAAYGVRRGSPFTKFDPADFRFGKDITIAAVGANVNEFEANHAVVEIVDDDFRIEVTGFDVNRDLHIDAKTIEREPEDATAT